MKTPRPAWWAFYSLLPLAAALLVAVGWWIPAGAGRMLAEAAVSLAILGGMALWVRANRVALVLREAADATEVPLRAWVAYQPPAPRRQPRAGLTSEPASRIAA